MVKVKIPQVCVSLTTIPSRIFNLKKTIESLLNQTHKPDKIFINIPFKYVRFDEEVDDETIEQLKIDLLINSWNHGIVEIVRGEDFGPATKYMGAFDKCKRNSILIAVDDDITYKKYFIKTMLKNYMDNPNRAYSFYVHDVHSNRMRTYWYNKELVVNSDPSSHTFGVGHGHDGFGFNPRLLKEVKEFFTKYIKDRTTLYLHDDLWVSFYLYYNQGVSLYSLQHEMLIHESKMTNPGDGTTVSEEDWKEELQGGLISKYGSTVEEIVEHKGKQSVIDLDYLFNTIPIRAVTPTNDFNKAEMELLLESVEKHNIELDVIGVGDTFNFMSKIYWFADYLNKLEDTNTIIVFMDAYDTFFADDITELKDKFIATQRNMIFSTEKMYSHQLAMDKSFYKERAKSPYQYINTGGIIGYAKTLKRFYNNILTAIEDESFVNDLKEFARYHNSESAPLQSKFIDQTCISHHLAHHHREYNADLDYECNLFYTPVDDWDEWEESKRNSHYEIKDNHLVLNNGNIPSIIHVPAKKGPDKTIWRMPYMYLLYDMIYGTHKCGTKEELWQPVTTTPTLIEEDKYIPAIKLVTTYYKYDEEDMKYLIESCKKHSIDWEVIGEGKTIERIDAKTMNKNNPIYPPEEFATKTVDKIRWYADYFNKQEGDETIIISLDANDTFFIDNLNTIFTKFQKQPYDILYSSERKYSHQRYGWVKDKWDNLGQYKIYKYINAGAFIGRLGVLRKLYNSIVDQLEEERDLTDMTILSDFLCLRMDAYNTSLDYECEFFYTPVRDWDEWNEEGNYNFDFIDNGIHLRRTRTSPSMIHVPAKYFKDGSPARLPMLEHLYNGIYNSEKQ